MKRSASLVFCIPVWGDTDFAKSLHVLTGAVFVLKGKQISVNTLKTDYRYHYHKGILAESQVLS